MADKINNGLVLLEIALLLAGVLYIISAIDAVENKGCEAYWDNYVPGVEAPENPSFSGQINSFRLERDFDELPSTTGLRLNGS